MCGTRWLLGQRPRVRHRMFAGMSLCLLVLCAAGAVQVDPAAASLFACGFGEVVGVAWEGGEARVSRRLEVGALEGVSAELAGRFGTTDECKVLEDGRVLVASSGGAVAVVDLDSERAVFAAPCRNAHSIALLPGGRVASAASVGAGGDRVLVHDIASGALVAQYALHSAHGLVHDAQRGRLYALGMGSLLTFACDGETGDLRLLLREPLPGGGDAGGHDLRAVPRSAELIVTTEGGVWRYDRDLRRFRRDPWLGGLADVKSVDVHPSTGRIAYVQAEGGRWWSERVRFANPAGELRVEGERFYKARWAGGGEGPPPLADPRPAFDGAGVGPDAPYARIAFGSCADEDDGTATAWRRAGALAPDAFVLLGDTPYIDSVDAGVQRRRHAEFRSFAPFADLARVTPMHATWDDHDFGRNDTDGRMPGKEVSRAAWVQAHAGPPFARTGDPPTYGAGDAGIYTSVRRGPIEVFLLDTRWFARTAPSEFDGDEPTLLGAAQWDWLRAGLRTSDAPFKVLACGMIWNGATRPLKTDHWGAYPAEFDGLCRFLGDEGITGVVLVGGDIHRSRVVVHDVTDRVGYPLTEFISSPMHDRVIGLANAPHPGLRFDTGEGHVVLEFAADAGRLVSTFHTPNAILHRVDLTAERLR